jgi:transposase
VRVGVVPPRQVKNLHSPYGRTGKDDRFDAYVLADRMRTDGHRFADLTRDSAPMIGLPALVRAREDLVEVRVSLDNQLRHNLELAFPCAVGLFCDLHRRIDRAFLRRSRTVTAAALLDEGSMAAWLPAESYSGRTTAAVFIDRLCRAPAG